MLETQMMWLTTLERLGALWIHDGDPKKPHARLTSGKCSDGYCNTILLSRSPWLLADACDALAKRIVDAGFADEINGVQTVYGPAMSGMWPASEFARRIGRQSGFLEKKTSRTKEMVVTQCVVTEGEKVLLIDDLINQRGTMDRCVRVLKSLGAEVVPLVCAFVNRSGKDMVGDRKIIRLVDLSEIYGRVPSVWTPSMCPLCKKGSKALRPKQHWNILKGRS